ncbi:MAG: hypothetical protein IIU08_10995, partial [Clostridia bacterium]|nr:hypothetical protein [Clostridia bacterium]
QAPQNDSVKPISTVSRLNHEYGSAAVPPVPPSLCHSERSEESPSVRFLLASTLGKTNQPFPASDDV